MRRYTTYESMYVLMSLLSLCTSNASFIVFDRIKNLNYNHVDGPC